MAVYAVLPFTTTLAARAAFGRLLAVGFGVLRSVPPVHPLTFWLIACRARRLRAHRQRHLKHRLVFDVLSVGCPGRPSRQRIDADLLRVCCWRMLKRSLTDSLDLVPLILISRSSSWRAGRVR